MATPGFSQFYSASSTASRGPDHSWHVLYTNYLTRILYGTVTSFTAEEQVHAGMVAEWRKSVTPTLEKAWAVEQSFTQQMRAAGITRAATA